MKIGHLVRTEMSVMFWGIFNKFFIKDGKPVEHKATVSRLFAKMQKRLAAEVEEANTLIKGLLEKHADKDGEGNPILVTPHDEEGVEMPEYAHYRMTSEAQTELIKDLNELLNVEIEDLSKPVSISHLECYLSPAELDFMVEVGVLCD